MDCQCQHSQPFHHTARDASKQTAAGNKPAIGPCTAIVRQLRPATLDADGFELGSFTAVYSEDFRKVQEAEYANMRPGKNAKNQLTRKTAWGAYQSDQFLWSDRREYSLPAVLNPEENGAVRVFDRLSDEFLAHPVTESLLRAVFNVWRFEADSYTQLYQIQLSAIRYEPTLDTPALPSPIAPHQDLVDGAIVLLNKTSNLVGGKNRLYDLDKRPLVELELNTGDVLFVRDAQVLHQVTPLLLEPGPDWYQGQRSYRDVLLIRFQRVGR